jgi:hypothetical protein
VATWRVLGIDVSAAWSLRTDAAAEHDGPVTARCCRSMQSRYGVIIAVGSDHSRTRSYAVRGGSTLAGYAMVILVEGRP